MSSVHLARQRSLYTAYTTRGRETMQREIAGLNEQMSTGLRINRASDDAGGYARARRLDALTDRYEQYQKSIDTARPWVTHTQDHLDRMGDLLQQAHEQGVRASNDTFSASDRADFADAIASLRAELVDNLNAQVGDEYLFAGVDTQSAAPFQSDGTPAGNALGTPAASLNYTDVEGDRTRRVGPNLDLAVNLDGRDVHQFETAPGVDMTITESLKNLEDALRDPNTATYTIEEALGQVDNARDHVVDMGARAGTIARRLDASAEQLEQSGIEYEARRSEIEDADYVEVLTRFQEKQGQLQAALQVSASVMQTSLLDYLR